MRTILGVSIKKISIALSYIVGLCFILGVVLYYKYPTTSPLTSAYFYVSALFHPHTAMAKSVSAFLPYWRIDDTQYTQFDTLSEVIYFSITVGSDGNFVTINGSETDPGWRWWNSSAVKDLIAKTQIYGDKFTLTVANLQNHTIDSLLESKTAQQTLVHAISQQVTSRNLDGINIDFEYTGDPGDEKKKAFTQLITRLSTTLHKEKPDILLSLDVLPMGGRKNGLFDFPALSAFFDRYILMTYDFYNNSSDIAGPIAPLYGFEQKKFLFDVKTTVGDYKKLLPSSKLLLGIPYYGWDWPVEDGEKLMSSTLSQTDENGYPEVLSYGRMRGDKDLIPSQCHFDTLAREPWCWYTDPQTGKSHQVWFENDASIKEKFSYANLQHLGGVAIWTLGYDKSYSNLWNLLQMSFTKK